MNHKQKMDALLIRYLENNASENDLLLLEQYLATPEGLKHLDQTIDQFSGDFGKVHLEQLQAEHDHGSALRKDRVVLAKTNSRQMFRALAASLCGLVMITAVYFYTRETLSSTVYETIAGQKMTITLPDNTLVMLNGGSSLSYEGSFTKGEFRSVILKGEAYFKVTSNPKRPFVVNTSGIAIRVLGTTFNVKSYEDDDKVETTLVEGKVIIEKNGLEHVRSEIIELLPDQKATFTKDTKHIMLEKVKIETEAAWVRGALVFDDERFADIIKDLERWYGTRIVVLDKRSLQCRFTARIENETLEEVMKLFKSIASVQYTINDEGQVIIEGTLCSAKAN